MRLMITTDTDRALAITAKGLRFINTGIDLENQPIIYTSMLAATSARDSLRQSFPDLTINIEEA